MCRYHRGVLSQYVHIGYITQALYCRIIRITFVAHLLNVFTCCITGPEHLMSTVEKKTVSLYILHHNVKCADATGLV